MARADGAAGGAAGAVLGEQADSGGAGDYRRLQAKVEELRPEIERLGLYAPRRR